MPFANLAMREEPLVMNRGDKAEPDKQTIASNQDNLVSGLEKLLDLKHTQNEKKESSNKSLFVEEI